MTLLKQLCTAAQAQINNDAPYVWLGSLSLIDGSSSVAWDMSVVSSMLLDPVYTGQSDTAIFNAITSRTNNRLQVSFQVKPWTESLPCFQVAGTSSPKAFGQSTS